MKKILENMDAAASGQKKAVRSSDANDMKNILESFDSAVLECGDMPPAPSMPERDKVRMNVNLSAEGKDGIEDLLDLMKGAQSGQDDMQIAMPSNDVDDMRKSLSMMDEPEGEPCPICGEIHEGETTCEEYANEPDEEYKDDNYMMHDMSGGLNRDKKAYPATQDGDNPMALESIKDRLWKALNEKKAIEEEDDDRDDDGDKDFDDVKIARMMASGMSKPEAIAKVKGK